MIRKNTDCYAILSHLSRYKSITEFTALTKYGVKRLSARINDLRKNGYKIKTIKKTIVKLSGRKTNVTERYILE